ncbi:hypothetical protein [Terrabacter sp. BE26]|uniref:hypothetical protein n=1 Tax=Terrabacter sp. BE26 TaxID=2898152 RepID=UPI0035BE5785
MFGRTPLRRLRRALTPSGTLVIAGGEGDRWIGGLQRQLGAAVMARTYPLIEAPDAVAQLQTGATSGRLSVTM